MGGFIVGQKKCDSDFAKHPGKHPFCHPLVLASGSARRQELLKIIWPHHFTVAPQDIDETPLKDELPTQYIKRVTLAKADSAIRQNPNATVLTSDTVVAVGRRILQKAADVDEARWQMNLISGRRHRVLTGVAVRFPGQKVRFRLAQTRLSIARMTDAQINAFIESNEWKGVAVYRLQGLFGRFVKSISGQPATVLGLPLFETAALLQLP